MLIFDAYYSDFDGRGAEEADFSSRLDAFDFGRLLQMEQFKNRCRRMHKFTRDPIKKRKKKKKTVYALHTGSW